MDIIDGIIIIVCGALCMPSIIAKKKPEAKELLAKIAQFQGWIGLACLGWGIWGVIRSIQWMGYGLQYDLIGWITGLGFGVILALVGFLLGFGMIQQFALKNAPAEAKAKAEEAHQKLVGMQIPLGFACLITGGWVIVYSLVLRNIFYAVI